jgi:hypothetical protein
VVGTQAREDGFGPRSNRVKAYPVVDSTFGQELWAAVAGCEETRVGVRESWQARGLGDVPRDLTLRKEVAYRTIWSLVPYDPV